jgi:hypothetical protein
MRRSFPLEMGRGDAGRRLVARLGCVRVVDLGSGREVLSRALEADANGGGLPPSVNDWRPMELTGAVSAEGLVGGLVVTDGSGADEVDDFFREYLSREMRVGDLLPAGFYAFRVGP